MRADWPLVPLGEVTRLDLNREAIDPGKSYAMVGVLSFARGLFDREPIENGNTSYKYFLRLKPDHIVMSQLFGWEGAIALSDDRFAGKYLSPQFPTFLSDENRLDRKFLGWLMRRPAFWADLGTRASGMGDRRRTLTPDAFFACTIPLPPLDEQRRIVARIEELAAKVEEARGLRRVAAEEVDAVRASAANDLFSDKAMAGVAVVALDEVSEVRAGVTLGRQLSGQTVRAPYLRVANVQDGHLDLAELKEVEIYPNELEKWQLRVGDLLLTEGGDWDKLGRGTVWQGEVQGCIHQNHIFRVRVDQSRFDPWFVSALVSSPRGKKYFQTASKQTTNLASINQRQLKAFPIFQISLDRQRAIVAELDALQAKVDAVKALQTETAAELDAMLPAILDKAFKGEL